MPCCSASVLDLGISPSSPLDLHWRGELILLVFWNCHSHLGGLYPLITLVSLNCLVDLNTLNKLIILIHLNSFLTFALDNMISVAFVVYFVETLTALSKAAFLNMLIKIFSSNFGPTVRAS